MELIELVLAGLAALVGIGFGYVTLTRKNKADTFQKEPSPAAAVAEPAQAEKVKDVPQIPEQLDAKLSQTRSRIWGRIEKLFGGGKENSAIFEDLEEILYTSDLGPKATETILKILKEKLDKGEANESEVKRLLRDELELILTKDSQSEYESAEESLLNLLASDRKSLAAGNAVVWIMAGVNGAGKTTTVGKIAYLLAKSGLRVLVAAGDTFRAAASEQLRVWTDRAAAGGEDSQSVSSVLSTSEASSTDGGASDTESRSNKGHVEIYENPKASPSGVAFEACQKAQSEKFDILLVDTAGRLHSNAGLMEELKKVERVIGQKIQNGPQQCFLVLDANNGQNAVQQAREFSSAIRVSNIILTKLDGSAKGGVAFAVTSELGLPVRLIGVGESIQDLRPFRKREFVESII
ncbi:MAG: signal recognition particle-docking protein FtsY [Bdellovibrionales bacterium CG10_big_fil_rev_8_21_14_0_10_45_34]|nr:MAG: signal recognition particle-docking protein FtsY [Bdellovibrionales bacterium CG10_big_fil_rev_8_21_14_0_10_45_34]